jgi:multidrug efflux system membrane fusion protein
MSSPSNTFKSRTGRSCMLLLLAALSVLASLAFQACAGKESPARATKRRDGGTAVPVSVAQVARRDVPIDLQVVGNVEAYLTVNVKSQVSGEITRVFFGEGDFVKKGEQLFTIDQRTFEGQLNQTQANLAKDQAVLAQIEANLTRDQAQEKYAQATAARYASLFERNLISREMMEQARTNAEAVSAAVRADLAAIQSARATVDATRAAVENAKVMLGYTVLRSPINGRTGNLDAKQGNVISPSTNLMTIHQVEPIYVTFSVPEARLRNIRKSQVVTAVTQDDPSAPLTGQVTFIDNAVDPSTGMIRLKATFPNPSHKLWPGQFVRVTLRLANRPDAIVVPSQVVQTGQDGAFAFVVKQDHTVESRPVVAGERAGDDLIILSGLKPGETVVTEGHLRLAPGSRVTFANEPGRKPAVQQADTP